MSILEERVRTGVVQFGDDWPGFFIRGDDALALWMLIDSVCQMAKPEDAADSMSVSQLESWIARLASVNACTDNDPLILPPPATEAARGPAESVTLHTCGGCCGFLVGNVPDEELRHWECGYGTPLREKLDAILLPKSNGGEG